MRYASLIAVGLAASVFLFLQPHLKAALDTTAFDGKWAITEYFHEYKDPKGPVAHAFTLYPSKRTHLAELPNWVIARHAFLAFLSK
jgi:hypothetical protein